MKIIQVQTQAEAGGAQRVSDMVGEGLRAKGHDVRTVFMYRKTDVYDQDPHADFVLPNPPGGKLGEIRASAGLIGYLRRQRPDAVICYQYYGVVFGTIGARLAGAKHIIANQSGPPQAKGMLGFASRIDRLMGQFGIYDYSIVNSAWNQEQFASYPETYKQRIRRIDHGVLGPDHAYDKTAAREAFGLPRDLLLAVCTGRQTVQKNQMALVRALVALPRLHLAIAGVGPERAAMIDFATHSGVRDRLHLVGEVLPSRIFEFIASGDVFIFPSLFETFGLSVAEGAMSGLPVISNDLPVLREVLADSKGAPAAMFIDTNDPDQIAAAINCVVSDADLRDRLTSAGKRMGARFSPASMCAAYEILLA